MEVDIGGEGGPARGAPAFDNMSLARRPRRSSASPPGLKEGCGSQEAPAGGKGDAITNRKGSAAEKKTFAKLAVGLRFVEGSLFIYVGHNQVGMSVAEFG